MSTYIRIKEFDPEALAAYDGTEVVVTDRFVMFWKPPAPFCQWTASPFEISGIKYNCAEQYMMAEKARLFGDRVTEQQILDTGSPEQQKKLGQSIGDFDSSVWAKYRLDVVIRGNIAKFRQNPEFKKALYETGDSILVEASPFDNVWGIGLAANDPKAHQQEHWTGLNLLGRALMKVRSLLESEA